MCIPARPVKQVCGTGLSASWAGGKNGREVWRVYKRLLTLYILLHMQVIDLLLPQVEPLLSVGGCFYLLTVKENNPGIMYIIAAVYNI